LTQLLLEDLKRNAPSRIVVVASEVHIPGYGRTFFHLSLSLIVSLAGPGPIFRWTLEELNDPKKFDGMLYYKNSKLANVWFTKELARRLEGTGVTCNCLTPGWIPSTGLGRNAPYILQWFIKYVLYYFHPLCRTEDHGRDAIVDAATNPNWDKVSGKYFTDMEESKSSDEANDAEKALKLWTLTESWINDKK
jgi:NAD(P)-dependent dehydrogenase (short-subunit alcohol dehydrogenase family)